MAKMFRLGFVRRRLCVRYPLLVLLFLILIICMAIQTFVAHQTGYDKIRRLQQLNGNIQKMFVSLQNLPDDLKPKPSPAGEPDLQLHHKNQKENLFVAELPDLHPRRWVDRTILPKKKPIEILPGEGISENKSNFGLMRDVVPQGTKLSEPVQQLGQRIAPSRPLKTRSETTCTRRTHIVFLKTHKTASSTILNILYRYGESRNLTFALPVKKHMQLFYPHFFAENFVEGVASHTLKEFHIMCNHMRFRKSNVANVMPEDTFYFSILRHPVAMMESLYTYYKGSSIFRKTLNLDSFLDSCLKDYQSTLSLHHFAHNTLAFDFGLKNNVTYDAEDLEEEVNMAVTVIEKDFDLILISEYFDESLILLRRALCWSLEDVVSFRLNSRSDKARPSLPPDTAEKIKKWNALDWRIYLHFNTTFWDKVERLVGEEQMKMEVNALRELRAKLADICLSEGGAVDPSKLKDRKLKPYQSGKAVIQGYNLNPLTDNQTRHKCLRLITPELQYTKLLYNKQFPDNQY